MEQNNTVNYAWQGPGIIGVLPDKCILCYACIRECPVNAIEVRPDDAHARIIPDRCIACGSCEQVCPTRAIGWHSDSDQVEQSIQSDSETIALVDPSISAEFPDISDYRNFIGMIRGLGFNRVYDVAYGVDLVASEYEKMLGDFKGKYWITSKCPAVNSCIRKYHPDLINNLIPVLPPYAALAQFVRRSSSTQPLITLITPCLACRNEIPILPEDCQIDNIISFRELRDLFKKRKLTETTFEYSAFDEPEGRDGSLFPMIHGMSQIIGFSESLTKGDVISCGGRQNMLDALQEFSAGLEIKKHLDIFYCDGCFMGPGMSENGEKFLRRSLVTEYAKKRIHSLDQEEHRRCLDQSNPGDIRHQYQAEPVIHPRVDESDIQDVLTLIGKGEGIQTDRGCQACGYRTCRDFAIAVASGFAKPEMCQTYSTRNHQDYIKNLRETNDQLAKVQRALQESEKIAHQDKEHLKEFADMLQSVLQRIPSGVMVVNDQFRIVQANTVLIDMLGEEAFQISEVIPGLKGADIRSLFPDDIAGFFNYVLENNQEIHHRDLHLQERMLNMTVFPIKKGTLLGVVLRDLSSPEVRKEELFSRITEVIDNNLEMVQKIGFLLGEGAAETERMLNSIINYFKEESTH